MFSRCLGYQHWVTPHTSAVIKVLAEKSGAFDVVESETPEVFVPGELAAFDAVIFNNTCPVHPRRDLFFDFVADEARAAALKENVIRFVAEGGGFVGIHGASLAFMSCPKWEEMQGCTFDYHPAQQEVRLNAADPDHLLVRAFGGEGFVHFEEPYLFRNKYTTRSFRPLLVMNTEGMVWREDKPIPSDVCYVAWIKRHGNGRVFYCSPSHNAQSFEDPRLLRFVLDGIQYALGDLECDDTPAEQEPGMR